MGTPITSLRCLFFFLGAGFLLLEAQIISKIALLFGTTWVVNSIVIAGLLVLILAANALVGVKPGFPTTPTYIALLATLVIGYVVPVRAIFFTSLPARIVAATLVLCVPVFFASRNTSTQISYRLTISAFQCERCILLVLAVALVVRRIIHYI